MSIAFKSIETQASAEVATTSQQTLLRTIDVGTQRVRQQRSKGQKNLPLGLAKVNADLVLRAFNTWAYKRQQPDNVEQLLSQIEAAIEAKAPVEFCLYWGKGPRHKIAAAEIECLDYLGSLGTRIAAVYEHGARFTLIFTDTHAALNGHNQESIDTYVNEMTEAAVTRGFNTCFLSELVSKAQADGCEPAPVPLHLLDKLSVTAAKWYRGEGPVTLGALRYLEMNMIEKRAVEHAFSAMTFITFNGGEVRELFPENMPIFYMYSVRRGVAVKPWFIEEARPFDLAETPRLVVGGVL